MIKCFTKNTLGLGSGQLSQITQFCLNHLGKKKNCVPKKADMKAYLICEWFKQLKTIGNFNQLQTY